MGRAPYRGWFGLESREDVRLAMGALERMGIAHLVDRSIGDLSGGERQLVLIARALVQEPRGLLLDEPEQFVTTLTERLLAYALGRQPEYFDQPTVRTIVRNAAADQHRWSSVILGIVESPAFLMRRTAE